MGRVVAYPVFTKQKSFAICELFVEGAVLERDTKGSIFYGVTDINVKTWRLAVTLAKTKDYPYYYIDNSYFDRGRNKFYRVSKSSIQYKGPHESDGKRFAEFGYEPKPWRSIDEGHIVVCPQSDTFITKTMPRQWKMWLPEAVAAAQRKWPGRRVVTREWSSNKPVQMRTLHDDLKGAGLVITHSSAAAVEAVIEGIPVHVSEVSALHGMVCSGDTNLRLQLLGALADNQWTLDEIKNGSAWRWLNR